MARKAYNMSPEAREAQSQRMKARWAERKSATSPPSPQQGVKQTGPSPTSLEQRAKATTRLHALLEENKLKPGEVGPQPPTPPLNPKPEPEDMRGGAISQTERAVGVAPDKSRPALDIVKGRDEQAAPPAPPAHEAPFVKEQLTMTIPDWETIDFQEAEDWLKMFTEMEQDARAILGRRQAALVPTHKCDVCKKDVPDGKERFRRTPLNKQTGMYEVHVICSTACYSKWKLGPNAKPAATRG